MPDVVTVMFVLPRYPATRAERYALAVDCLPRLVDRWLAMKLPVHPSMHVLVSRPGQLGPSQEAATHRSDQLDGLAAESGGEGVAVSLTDDAQGVEEFVAVTTSSASTASRRWSPAGV